MADKTSDLTLSDLVTGKRRVNTPANVARAVLGQGLGMGWGDEAEAWLRSKLENSPGYEAELKKIQGEYGQFSQENPIMQPALEIVGGAAPTLLAMLTAPVTGGATAPAAAAGAARTGSLLARIAANPYARGAGTGLVTGTISGAGSAEPGQRGSGALVGGAAGTVLGGTLPAVARGAGAVTRFARERFLPSDEFVTRRAAETVNEALTNAGLTPAQAEQMISDARQQGIPLTLANVNSRLADLAESVAQRPGRSAGIIEEKLIPLQQESRERVLERTRDQISRENYFSDRDSLISDLRGKAKTVYDDAYYNPDGTPRVVDDPTVNYILTDPRFREAYNRGKAIAQTEAMAAKLRGEDPNRYLLPEIFESRPTGKRDAMTNAPIMEDVLVQQPTVRVLDYVKRGLDDIVDSGFKGSSSVGKAQATALRDLRNQFRSAIDNLVPEYKNARSVYAGDMEVRDAMELGFEKFKSLSHEEIKTLFQNMSPAERDAFRSGVSRHLFDVIAGPSQNVDAARLLSGPRMLKKLEPLFDSPAQFDLFKSAILRESQLFRETNKILSGSQTSKRIVGQRQLETDPGMGEALMHSVMGNPQNSLSTMALRFLRSGQFTDEKASRIAELLMSSDPSEVAAAVQVLDRYGAQAAARAPRLGAAERALVKGSATAFPAAPPPPVDERNTLETQLSAEPPMPEGPSLLDELNRLEEEQKRRVPGSQMQPPR